MNRRSFLGASAGATIAGPDVARSMAQAIQKQNFASGVGSMGLANSTIAGNAVRMMEPEEAVRKAYQLGVISRETLEKLLQESGLGEPPGFHNLDPDLQAAKSFSLGARVRMQRERHASRRVDRWISPPKNMWEFGRDLLAKGIVNGDGG